MANISHESLICSDLNKRELKRIQSCGPYDTTDFDSSITIDSYRELPRNVVSGSRIRSSSVHIVYDDQNDEKESVTTLSYIYKKIAAFFFVFNRFSVSSDIPSDIPAEIPVVSNEASIVPFVRSFSMLYDLRLKDKIYDTMDYLIKYNRKATDRLVAMITSVPLHLDKFDFYKYFTNFDYSLSECFALFIEQPPDLDPSTVEASDLDKIPDNIKCEVVNKRSLEVISESGPYKCLYEHNVDSITDNSLLDEMLCGVSVKKGKVRFFHKIKNLGRKDSKKMKNDVDEPVHDYFKQRFSTFTEYLSKRTRDSSGENQNKWNARTYFNVFSRKPSYQDSEPQDDSARERFEDHIRHHTLHWDEVQYDDIEIILRDDNDNSIVKLPYSCRIM
ncbi:hypothetical protein TpMuguga_04g00713 [Theileria parva strain Muguga]|uniref:Uncharacterized protein n=1 Tax=Theileria parva TaxID=5875 RepID=Q4N3J1_THEPA|nr:uncharacterized protein TpMuguga_04g00713 [Theileria parva strain Muguga]EAN32066.1 hypothetical protein TpMuguga_04g00713 [Theileria parva strain Muguga]|eukprot:XP_764349.1 hypothetical protein [Theileria parva strain Muguga]